MIFSAKELSAGYGGRKVINNVSFTVNKGELVGILGANGCGKTTLIKAICGILPHKGSCSVGGKQLELLNARQVAQLCGYIPQRSGITIDMDVLDVVLMGFNPSLPLLGTPTGQMRADAFRALEKVGLTGFEEKNYHHKDS